MARAVASCRSTRTCVTTFCAPSGGDDASPLPVAVVRRSFSPARDDDFPPAFSSAMPGQFGARADLNRSDTNSGNRSDTNSPVRLCWAGSVCRPGHKGSPGDTHAGRRGFFNTVFRVRWRRSMPISSVKVCLDSSAQRLGGPDETHIHRARAIHAAQLVRRPFASWS
jgi:hypothetical protein